MAGLNTNIINIIWWQLAGPQAWLCVLMWSVHHLQCTRVCVPYLSLSTICKYMRVEVCSGQLWWQRAREKQKSYRFLAEAQLQKRSVWVELWLPPFSHPLPLSLCPPICLEYTRYLSIHLSILPLPHPSQSLGLNKACDVLSLSSIPGCQHISEEYVSKFVRLRKRVFIF